MSQTKEGAIKARKTMIEKYGEDYYKKNGAKGGRVKNPAKGFGTDNRTMLEKLRGVPSRASIAGRKGGKVRSSERAVHA